MLRECVWSSLSNITRNYSSGFDSLIVLISFKEFWHALRPHWVPHHYQSSCWGLLAVRNLTLTHPGAPPIFDLGLSQLNSSSSELSRRWLANTLSIPGVSCTWNAYVAEVSFMNVKSLLCGPQLLFPIHITLWWRMHSCLAQWGLEYWSNVKNWTLSPVQRWGIHSDVARIVAGCRAGCSDLFTGRKTGCLRLVAY